MSEGEVRPPDKLPHPKMLNQRARKILGAQVRDVPIELDDNDGFGSGFAKPATPFLKRA
jgi:hypothetical protein